MTTPREAAQTGTGSTTTWRRISVVPLALALLGAAAASALVAPPAAAQVAPATVSSNGYDVPAGTQHMVVDTLADDLTPALDDGTCSLREAMLTVAIPKWTGDDGRPVVQDPAQPDPGAAPPQTDCGVAGGRLLRSEPITTADGSTFYRHRYVTDPTLVTFAVRGTIRMAGPLTVPQALPYELPDEYNAEDGYTGSVFDVVIDGAGALLADGSPAPRAAGDGPLVPITLDGQGQHRIINAVEETSRSTETNDYPPTRGTLGVRNLELTGGNACAPDQVGPCRGGAILGDLRVALHIDRATFTDNRARIGSAVLTQGGSVRNSTFAHNTLRADYPEMGAALATFNYGVEVHGNTFFGNTADGPANFARDLGRESLLSHPGPLELSLNAFVPPAVIPAGTTTCYIHLGVGGAPTVESGGDVGADASCGLNGTSTPPTPHIEGSQALLDHGGWVRTIAFVDGSTSHDAGGNDTLSGNVACREAHEQLGTLLGSVAPWYPAGQDARGVARASSVCDAGALERAAQTIDFPQPGAPTVGTTLPLPTADSGAPVEVTVAAASAGVCEVTEEGLRLLAVGSCSATAEAAGTALHRVAPPVTRTFDVAAAPKQARTITFDDAPTTAVEGGSWTITAHGSDGSTPDYSIDATSVGCSLDGAGTTVSFDDPGTCVVRASLAENATHVAATATTSIEVSAPQQPQPQLITFSPAQPVGFVRQPLTLTATGGGSGNQVVVSVVQPPRKASKTCKIAASSSTGAVTTVRLSFSATGTCTLQANQAGGTLWQPASVRLSFEVKKASKPR